MKNVLFLFLLSAVLVSSAAQSYVQNMDATGRAAVEERRDMSVFLQLLPGGSLGKIADTCASIPSLSCSVSGNIMTTRIQLGPDSGYYSFDTQYGLPFLTTTLTVNRLPTDMFDASVSDIMNKAGVTSGKGRAAPIDLNDKGANAATAAAWKEAGLDIDYSIVMPNGHTETYRLTDLLADSHPIVITTQEPDFGLMALIIGILVLAAFAFSFFGKRKKAGKR